MHTETIAGLHKCQPKNAPEAGTIKNMVVLNMPAKNGKKAWIKIKSEKPEKGGSPYRLLNVEPLDWPPDDYGNIAFNIEVEATTAQPPSFIQQARATMQQGEPMGSNDNPEPAEWRTIAPQSPPHAQQGEDGVTEARKHLMQSCNLLNLCIAAVNKAIAPNVPEIAQTSEFFQAQVATLFIEASRAGFVFKMPTSPVNGGKHAATVKTIQKEEEESSVPF